MEKEKRLDLKQRVEAVGRLAVAELVEMPYGTLGAKLGGFALITDEEVGKIESAISSIENCGGAV